LDSHTAVTDIISQAGYWDANDLEPEWYLEYSAKSTYSDPDSPLDPHEPLSPAFWHDAVERMKEDRELFKTYLTYESKSSAEAAPCHKGSACEAKSLCQMQASTVIQEGSICEDALGARNSSAGLQ
jgi:sphingomyelin phosphodiesterase